QLSGYGCSVSWITLILPDRQMWVPTGSIPGLLVGMAERDRRFLSEGTGFALRRRIAELDGGVSKKSGRVAPEKVDQLGRSGDIAAHHPKRLAQRSMDHGQPIHGAVVLSEPATGRAVDASE